MFAKLITTCALLTMLASGLLAVTPIAAAQPQPEPPISESPAELAVRLKGTGGGETFELRIGTLVVASGEATTEWQTIAATAPRYAHGIIEVAFVNDARSSDDGLDRNLIVDYLDISTGDAAVRIESESPVVYSEGAYGGIAGCSPGFVQQQILACAGSFVYGDLGLDGILNPAIDPHGNQRGLPAAKTNELDIVARGHFGGERFTVRVGGSYVGEAATTRFWRTYRFFVDPKLTGKLEIVFEGDYFADGIDTNLDVDYAALRGQHFEAESPNTKSTGTYTAANGCKAGYKQSQTLHCNGKFVLGSV